MCVCVWLKARGGGVEGAPARRSWENRASLYGAVTGEDGLSVTCCQSGGVC